VRVNAPDVTAPDPAAAPYPSSAYAWYVVVVLFFAYVVSILDRQILTLLVEPIKQDLGMSDTMISLLHGFAFAIFYTFLGIPIGRLADAHNRQRIIMGGVFLWSIMTSLCGFARNAVALFGFRIGVAVGEAALSPCAYSIISDYFPREMRGRAMSVYSLGIFAGAGMAYMFGGVITAFAAQAVALDYPLLSSFKPWQLTFVLAGLPGIVVVLLMLTVREPVRRERASAGSGSVPLREVFAYLRHYWLAYFSIFFGVAFVAMATYSLFAWLPAYFIRVHEYTPRRIGLTFGTIILTVGTTGLLLAGYFADLWYRRGAAGAHLLLSTVMSAIAIVPGVLFFFVDSATAALACITVLVFFLAAHTGLVPASLQLITPNELRGQVTAVYLFILNLIGLGMGPTVVALITDRYYRDPLQVGNSMSITLSVALTLGVLLFASGMRAYTARQHELHGPGAR
jgi:MFS family permease